MSALPVALPLDAGTSRTVSVVSWSVGSKLPTTVLCHGGLP